MRRRTGPPAAPAGTFRLAIVGRPNVGKSTLFNRLIGKRLALVDDTPGVTRDFREGAASLGGMAFGVFDTAGWEEARRGTLEQRMREQTEKALARADAALLLVDAREGVTALDRSFARWLRGAGKPVLVAANKCEGRAGAHGLAEAHGLGFGDPIPLSAEHGEGLGDLYDALVRIMPPGPETDAGEDEADEDARPRRRGAKARAERAEPKAPTKPAKPAGPAGRAEPARGRKRADRDDDLPEDPLGLGIGPDGLPLSPAELERRASAASRRAARAGERAPSSAPDPDDAEEAEELAADHGGFDVAAATRAALAELARLDAEGALEDDPEPAGSPGKPIKLAIVGRPNVGKSTLLNRLLGEERVLTGPEAGITRDSISVDWTFEGRALRLVDTAGLRRKSTVSQKLESLSVAETLRAIRLADVVIVTLDAAQMLEKQDLAIARLVVEEGRALVIAVNKADLLSQGGAGEAQRARQRLADRIEASLAQAKGVPTVPVSALTGRGVERLVPAALAAYDVWNRRVPTGAFNRWLAFQLERHPPPLSQGRRIRIRYGTQVKARPPTFALFVSRPAELPESYERFLVNQMRRDFGLPGTPIRIVMRKPRNPYSGG